MQRIAESPNRKTHRNFRPNTISNAACGYLLHTSVQGYLAEDMLEFQSV